MMKTILDWLSTVIFYSLFFLTLLIFEIIFRVCSLLGDKSLASAFGFMNKLIIFWLKLVGMKLDIEWLEELDPKKNYIFVSNHQSMFDIPILHSIFNAHQAVFVAKKELAYGIPGISFPLRKLNSCLIDRKNGKAAIKQLAAHGQKEVSTIFFPEGTRLRDGTLGTYNKAGLIALLKASDLQTVSVVLDGAWKITEHKYGPLPFGLKIKVKIDKAKRGEDLKEHLREIESWTIQELKEMRA